MKTTKILAFLIAAIVILSALMLASCENSTNGKDSDTEIDTAEATEPAESGDESETETETRERIYDTLPLETVSEEFDATMIGDKYTTKSYKFIKNNLFKSNDGVSYNWYEIFNACVTGELNVKDEDCQSYAAECLEYFEEFGLEDEAAQATTLIEAAK